MAPGGLFIKNKKMINATDHALDRIWQRTEFRHWKTVRKDILMRTIAIYKSRIDWRIYVETEKYFYIFSWELDILITVLNKDEVIPDKKYYQLERIKKHNPILEKLKNIMFTKTQKKDKIKWNINFISK